MIQSSLPDDELLDVPVENLTTGELSRAFRVKADHTVKKQEEEQSARADTQKTHQQEQAVKDQEHEQFERREELLLNQLREREQEIFEEAQQLDARAIKLHDGRRAYVDGDKFRDAEGKVLGGSDRAEAEQHHLDQPNAATWQEHQHVETEWQQTERLRHQVETLKAAPDSASAAKAMTAYEKDFARQTATRTAESPEIPDYGSGDVSSTAADLVNSFKTAVTPSPKAAAPASTQLTPAVAKPGALAF